MDQIRETIIARAEKLGLTANAISVQCGGSPNPEATRRYLTRKCGLGSQYVSTICDVLGLELRPKRKAEIVTAKKVFAR
jgi:lambda repressor-like predicted transcriptional regulator